MREKRTYIIITFETTTDAMQMEKRCMERQIPGRLIPLPTSISAGCGLSWRIKPEEYVEYEDRIKGLDISWEAIYQIMI